MGHPQLRSLATRAGLLVGLLIVVVGWWLLAAPAAAQPTPTSPATTVTSQPAGIAPPAIAVPPAPVVHPPPPAPGLFDVAGRVREAINSWVRELVARAIGPAVDLAARSVLATPELTAADGRVRELWQRSQALANAGYVLLVCAGGVLLMTNETLQARYTVKEAAPKLVVGMVAANTSLLVVDLGIQAANGLSRALLSPGVDPAQAEATLKAVLVFPLDGANTLVLVAGVVVTGLAVVLAASYVLRVAVLVALTVAAPLALACHGLPHTEAVARWWWRATAACLAIPVAQSLVLICALQVFFHHDRDRLLGLGGARLVDLLVATCLLWLLARIPAWAARLVFVGRPGMVVTAAKSYVAYRLVRRGLARLAP
jgi:hypothetical protein